MYLKENAEVTTFALIMIIGLPALIAATHLVF